jgi:ATP-binding cassette, subfamily B, bacterial MsbA
MGTWATWRRLLQYTRGSSLRLGLAIALSVAGAVAAAGWAAVVGPVLTAVLTGRPGQLGPFAFDRGALTSTLPALIVGLATAKALSSWLHAGLMGEVTQHALHRLRIDLYGHLLRLAPTWFEQRHSAELVTRLTSDVTAVEFAIGQALSSWVKDALVVLAMAGVCLAQDARLFVLLALVVPAMVIPVSRFAKAAKRTATASQASLGHLTTLLTEALWAAPVVQSYRAEAQLTAHFEAAQADYLTAMKRSLLVRGAFTPVTEWLGIIGVALAVVAGARAVAAEPALAGHLISFFAAALLVYQPVKALSGTASQVSAGLGAAQRLFEVLDAPAETTGGTPVNKLARAIRVEAASVTYADGRVGLNQASVTISAGTLVAIVGASGAGKSTLAGALLGLHSLSHGHLWWDDVDLATADRQAHRAQLAWVPQTPVLLMGSVRDALRLGAQLADDETLWLALRQAGAEMFVRALPAGLDASVSERGANFSGGQRQRLALARALVRHPSLLVLDEPTSALDTEAEAAVRDGLQLLRGRCTTVVIAHRLETVRHADMVVVLDEGRVVQTGTHHELASQPGPYAQLLNRLT